MLAKIRIATGLVLFAFVFCHLVNLAFGLVSIDALEAARKIIMAPWSNPVGGPILMLAFILHGLLGLWALYRRTTLWLGWGDAAQALLGVAVLPLILPHIMGTAIGPAMSGAAPDYPWVLAVYWLFAPGLGVQQVLAVIVIWIHGCYGLFLWLHVQPWWGQWGGLTYPVALLVPVLALLGFVEAGKTLIFSRHDEALMAPIRETSQIYNTVAADLWVLHDRIIWVYGFLVLAVLVGRMLRDRHRKPDIEVSLADYPPVRRAAGLSLLDIAQAEGHPHTGLCGGRGRCGSCAVRVHAGAGSLSSIAGQEAATLAKLRDKFPVDQLTQGLDVRLACQAVPHAGLVRIDPIFPNDLSPLEYRELLQEGVIPGDLTKSPETTEQTQHAEQADDSDHAGNSLRLEGKAARDRPRSITDGPDDHVVEAG